MTSDLAGADAYRAILDTISDGVAITEADTGIVLAANPALCRMHGYSEMTGLRASEFIAESSWHVFSAKVAATPSGQDFRERAEHVRRDGTRFDVELVGHALHYEGRRAVLVIVRDISDQVRIEQELEHRVADRTRQLESLLRVSRAVASTLELSELVRLILDQLREVVPYNAASLILIEGHELVIHDLLIEGTSGLEPQPSGLRFPLASLPRSASEAAERPRSLRYPCVQVAASPEFWERMRGLEPVVIHDVLRSDGQLAEDYRATMGDLLHLPDLAYMRTWMATPLAVKGSLIGYVGVSSNAPGYFTHRHALLAQAFADHAAVAIDNARLYERAQQLAVLEERQRLARDLHDSVAQALYGIALGARTASRYLETGNGPVAEPIEYVISLAAAGLAEMRALIFDLHPRALEHEGLVAAINRQIHALRARHDLAVEPLACDEPQLPPAVKDAVYGILREALHNVVKHAQACAISVTLEVGAEDIRFGIRDDGIGFDPTQRAPGHLGLRSMQERAERLGGGVSLSSAPGSGTLVAGSIPLERAVESERGPATALRRG